MSRPRTLRWEALEPRELLSRSHLPAHPAVRAPATPLVLDGTLSVDQSGMVSSSNADGSTSVSAPVVGQFNALGTLRGVWIETTDPYGDMSGPDTLRLHNSQGAFEIVFNNVNRGKGHPLGPGAIEFQHPQHVTGGLGAYAHSSERGTIQVITSNARTHVVSLKLAST